VLARRRRRGDDGRERRRRRSGGGDRRELRRGRARRCPPRRRAGALLPAAARLAAAAPPRGRRWTASLAISLCGRRVGRSGGLPSITLGKNADRSNEARRAASSVVEPRRAMVLSLGGRGAGVGVGAARRRRVWLAGLEVSWKTRALGPRPGSYR
jgi:hypothetical protein